MSGRFFLPEYLTEDFYAAVWYFNRYSLCCNFCQLFPPANEICSALPSRVWQKLTFIRETSWVGWLLQTDWCKWHDATQLKLFSATHTFLRETTDKIWTPTPQRKTFPTGPSVMENGSKKTGLSVSSSGDAKASKRDLSGILETSTGLKQHFGSINYLICSRNPRTGDSRHRSERCARYLRSNHCPGTTAAPCSFIPTLFPAILFLGALYRNITLLWNPLTHDKFFPEIFLEKPRLGHEGVNVSDRRAIMRNPLLSTWLSITDNAWAETWNLPADLQGKNIACVYCLERWLLGFCLCAGMLRTLFRSRVSYACVEHVAAIYWRDERWGYPSVGWAQKMFALVPKMIFLPDGR